MNVNKEDNKHKPANQLEINFKEKLKDPELKNFFDEFTTTPSFNIVYKFKCQEKDQNLKKLILIDELIKVLISDKHRLYFDHCLEFVEAIPDDVRVIKINSSNLFLNIGEQTNGLHVYNLISLRSKKEGNLSGFKLENLQTDGYLVKYEHLKLYFDRFEHFLSDKCKSSSQNYSEKFTNLRMLTYKEESLNILIFEIKTFIYLVKTGTLYVDVEKLQLIPATIFLIFQSVEYYSALHTNPKMGYNLESYKHFETILNNFFSYSGLDQFSFVSSILYEILLSNPVLTEKYEYYFLSKLKELKLTPTFNIFIKANNENKGKNIQNQYYIKRDNVNVKFKAKPIAQFIFCFNQCFESKDTDTYTEAISYTKMTSLKCKVCGEENFLKLNNWYEGKEDAEEIPLKHPMEILIEVLDKIVERKSLIFDQSSLKELYEKGENHFESLIFYLRCISAHY